jgi:WD40 repeat protein
MARRILAALVAVACLSFAACKPDKPTGGNKPANENGGSEGSANVGGPLFQYAEFRPAHTEGRAPDPVTVPMANVVILRKTDLASRVDGTVLFIGVETTGEEAARLNPADVFRNPRDKKVYRRLQPGNLVTRDKVVALLDDEQAFLEFTGASTKAASAKASAEAYKLTVAKLREIVRQTQDGVNRNIVPMQELLNSQATEARYTSELVDHQGSADVAGSDAEKAKYVWEKHFLKPAVEGEVQQILKHEGEGVKAAEPLLTVYDFTKLRAVGLLPKEYVSTVGIGDPVTIELTVDVPPGAVFDQHTTNRPIAAVAVGAVGGKPVIVSAGEDGWVYVWDRDQKVLGSTKVVNGVRSLAVTRPEAGAALALVGGVNGTATVIDLTSPSAKGRDLEGKHDGGVAAAAFSPDGRYCVTADERAIYMYDVGNGKRKYTFPTREHHSPITSLSFTPQGLVVSAGREPSVRVWKVGQDGASVAHRIDARSGDVGTLGVTDDGSRLLLDADKTRLDVLHLQDLRKERPLITAGEGGRFNTFAVWSPELDKKPDNRLIATTGAVEGVVQLWRAPTAELRGTEVARMVTRDSAAATCCAFSPIADNGFVVVGTRKGAVQLWPLPGTDVKAEIPAVVTAIPQEIESSGRTLNVLVDFDNPKIGERFLLRPGSAVTLVIKPKK